MARKRPQARPSVRDYRGEGAVADRSSQGTPGPVLPVSFVVPGKPLSINRAYRIVRIGGHGRLALTPEAVSYKARVRQYAAIAMAHQPMLTGDLRFRLTAYWPRRAGDSDAALKPTKDACQGFVFANDRIVVQDVSTRDYDPDYPRVVITVEPMAPVVERVLSADDLASWWAERSEGL